MHDVNHAGAAVAGKKGADTNNAEKKKIGTEVAGNVLCTSATAEHVVLVRSPRQKREGGGESRQKRAASEKMHEISSKAPRCVAAFFASPKIRGALWTKNVIFAEYV